MVWWPFRQHGVQVRLINWTSFFGGLIATGEMAISTGYRFSTA